MEALLQTSFFGRDLKYGVYTYGGIMFAMTIYYIFYPSLSF